MRNIKLTLEYDGTEFVGWQFQPNGRSVQAVVEDTLAHILNEEIRTHAAGRTDAGVHARGQVVNFRSSTVFTPSDIRRGVNALLPKDVVVIDACDVDEAFHARYSAKARSYSYHIVTQPTSLLRRFTWYVSYRLEYELLEQAATAISGSHNFRSFSKNGEDTAGFACNIHASAWCKKEGEIVYAITGNRFLHGMVRALVGTMIEIGRGHRDPADLESILQAQDRQAAGMAAPSQGLFLDSVTY